jgi:hypothetical protein
MEIKDVFSATPQSSFQVLCETGLGFYIPVYQRQYSWSRENITRMMDDIIHGVVQLTKTEDAITFLGTLINIHDIKYQTVQPQVRPDLPAKVLLIIDGQQRATTLLLLNTILHEEIVKRSAEFEKGTLPETIWISQQSKKLSALLKKTFVEDMSYGDDVYQYYPRAIRAYEDTWSRTQAQAKYVSPISAYLHGYIKHDLSGETKNFDFSKIVDMADGRYKLVIDNCKDIRKFLKKEIASLDPGDFDFPSSRELADTTILQEVIFNVKFPEHIYNLIERGGEVRSDRRLLELLRLLVFAGYVLNRVAVTVVTAKNEDYAFDMFEALNTTGEPLTAIETFRPKIIYSEGVEEYENSKSRTYMKIVDNYLDKFSKAQDRQRATNNILIPFALAESGDKLPKRLNDQRRFLRDTYEAYKELDEKREFLRHLSYTTEYYLASWDDTEISSAHFLRKKPKPEEIQLVDLVLTVLRDSNHQITIAPLQRFYSRTRNSRKENLDAVVQDFCQAVLATFAFVFLWRASRTGTDNIDSYFRLIMRSGWTGTDCTAISRRPNRSVGSTPSASAYKTTLRAVLKEKGGVETKEVWIQKTKNMPLYKVSKHLAKFALLAGAHDTVLDRNAPDKIKKGKPGSFNVLNVEEWRKSDVANIEHIAPLNPEEDGWDKSLYDDVDTVHTLGNLSLLPATENKSIGNRSWETKRLMYKALAAESIDIAEQHLESLLEKGIELSESTRNILLEAQYLPHVRAIGEELGNWSAAVVNARCVMLFDIIWDRIAPWLGIETGHKEH